MTRVSSFKLIRVFCKEMAKSNYRKCKDFAKLLYIHNKKQTRK